MLENNPATAPITHADETCLLSVSNVSFMRNENVIFEDISFSLGPGDLFQIDGANGSGKSTLLRVLAGLLAPSGGKVVWRMNGAKESAYQKTMSYIGHKNAIKDDLSPLENLEYVKLLKHKKSGISPREALQVFHLDRYRNNPVGRMSAGQKRKVALARLLITNTRVWLLDEPFTALDFDGKKILEGIIKDHLEQGGLVIFATHQAIEIESCSVQHFHLI